jgi:PAS domain S-box-containing protein
MNRQLRETKLPSEHNHARLYKLLIHELQDFAVFLIDIDGQITSWNPGVERFFGYTEPEFVGKNVAEIFTPQDRDEGAPEKERDTARRNGRSADIRWHVCRDQSWVFVEGVLTAIQDESGNLCGFSKIARAVRPQQAAGNLIATILVGTEDVIYAIDTNGRFVFANMPAARLMGRRVEDLIGHTREELLPSYIAADMRATDESVMAGAQTRMVEEKFPTSDRGERIMLMSKTPWRDDLGGVIGLVAIGHDVTSRVRSQEERERLLREVRRSNEELSAFSHVVAHDLRTPLRAVRTYAELLARHLEGRLDPTASQFMTFVTEGSESMEQLIDSLLRYAESGNELSTTRVNVNAVIDGLLRRLDPVIRETSATVTVDTLPEVQADPMRLLQLIQNLIVNAINYRGSEPPRIRISAEASGNYYRFAVADNGMGIPREHSERIFLPLQRLESKNVPGTGIGLALCRKIVERHGGRIWVESVVGEGSTFLFTLPIHQNSAAK